MLPAWNDADAPPPPFVFTSTTIFSPSLARSRDSIRLDVRGVWKPDGRGPHVEQIFEPRKGT